MFHKIKKTAFLFLTIIISQNISAAYLVSELGRLPGYLNYNTPAALVDLNNNGEVAGTVYRYTDLWFSGAITSWYYRLIFNEHDFRAFYASEFKGLIDIGDLGGNVAAALSINNAGKVGGWSMTTGPYLPPYVGNLSWNPKGFVWDSNGITQIEHSYVLDIDNDDSIVTNDSIYQPSSPDSPQIHKRNDVGQSIDHGFGFENTIFGFPTHKHHYPYENWPAQKINCISYYGNGFGCTAFFHNDGEWFDIGTLGGSWSTAYELNNNGQVVGASTIDDVDNSGNDGQIRAFLWHNNVIKDLIAEATILPSDAADTALLQNGNTRALSINNNGQILIEAYPSDQDIGYVLSSYVTTQRYYLWEDNVITKIEAQWPNVSSDLPYLQLSAINDLGQIAGFGGSYPYRDDRNSSEWHVVLITPESQTTDIELSISGEGVGLINQNFDVEILVSNIGTNPASPQLSVSIPKGLSTISLPDACIRETTFVTCLLGELGLSETHILAFSLSGSQMGTYKIDASVVSTTISDPIKNNNIANLQISLSDTNPSLQISFPQDNSVIGRDPDDTGSFQLVYSGADKVNVFVDDSLYSTETSKQFMINNLSDGEHYIKVEAVNSAGQSLGYFDSIHVHVAKETVIEVGYAPHSFGNVFTHDLDIKGDFLVAVGAKYVSELPVISKQIIYYYHYQNGEWQKIFPQGDLTLLQNEGAGGVASSGGLTSIANIINQPQLYSEVAFTGKYNSQQISTYPGPWIPLVEAPNGGGYSTDFGNLGFSLDIEGSNTIVFGQPDNNFIDRGLHSGGVRIVPGQILGANDLGVGDLLGYSVAIENGIVVAGAIGDDENGSFSGAAYIYDLGADPSSPQKLLAEDGAAFDRFGHGVGISNGTIAVGAPLNDEAGNNIGAIYLYNKVDAQWLQTNKLMPTNYKEPPIDMTDHVGSGATFGNVVQFDDNIIVTTGAMTDRRSYNPGEVHFFRHTNQNGWGKSRKIISSNSVSSSYASPYMAGYDVSVSGNFLGVKTNTHVHIFELSDVDYAADFSMTYQQLELVNDPYEPPNYTNKPHVRLLGQLDLFNLGPNQPSSEVVITFPKPVIVSRNLQCEINPENQSEVTCFIGDIVSTEPNQFNFWLFQDHESSIPLTLEDIVIFGPANEGDSFLNSDIHASIRSRWPDPNTDNNNVIVRFPNTDYPLAQDDNYSLAEGEDYTATTSVLNNDSDLLSRTLTIEMTSVQAPSYGELTINSDGTFRYQHDGSESIQDNFIYQISNDIETATATVFLNITAVNDTPIVENDEYNVEEGSTLEINVPGVLENDSDVDGDNLTVSLLEQALHGLVTLKADGQFTYIHDGSEQESDQFTYTLSDGKETVVGTVVLTITNTNDLPIVEDANFQIESGGKLEIAAPGLLTNAKDNDGDSLTLATTVVTEPSYGMVTLSSDGAFTYSHNGTQDDSDFFVFRISDGQSTVDARVTITILHSNNAPQAVVDEYTLNEGATLTIEEPGLLNNDIDLDGDPLIVNITPQKLPQYGILTLNVDGSFQYVHDGSQTLEDSFVYAVSDGEFTDTAIVSLTMTNINDLPVAEPNNYLVAESGLLEVETPGLLDNDVDADGDPLTVLTEVASGPSHGTLILNSDGSFSYQHNGDEINVDHFTYQVTDGFEIVNALVTINISSANDAPLANPDDYALEEGGTLTIDSPGLLENDTDAESNQLNIITTPKVAPSHGILTLQSDGSFVYTHDGSENREDSFTYTVSDGIAIASATVSLTIQNTNDKPVAASDFYEIHIGGLLEVTAPGLLENDTDNDNELLLLSENAFKAPQHGIVELHSDGSFTYQHDGSQTANDSFEYAVSDQNSETIGIANITIFSNNAPPIAADQQFETIEDTSIENQQLVASDSENDPLIFTVTMKPIKGTLSLTSDGLFSYQPFDNENGEDQFKFTVNDGSQDSEIETTVTIQITAQNDAPKASDQRLLVQQAELSGNKLNVRDIDSDDFSFHIVDGPEKGEINLNENTGEFEYISGIDQRGPDSFSFQVSDGEDTSNIATVNITINSRGNKKPTKPKLLSPAENSTDLSTAVEFIWENSEDEEGDQLRYSILICSNADFLDCDSETVRKISVGNLFPLTGVSIALLGLSGTLRRRRYVLFAAIIAVIILNGCEDNSSLTMNIDLDPNNKAVDLSHTVSDLKAGTQYFWKIIVEDPQGGVSESETWMFVTADK